MKTVLSLLVLMVGIASSASSFAKSCYLSDAFEDETASPKGDAAYYTFFEPSALPAELTDKTPTVISSTLFRVQLALNKEDRSLTYVFEQRDPSAPDKFIAQPAQVIPDVESLEAAEDLPIQSQPVQINGLHLRAQVGCR